VASPFDGFVLKALVEFHSALCLHQDAPNSAIPPGSTEFAIPPGGVSGNLQSFLILSTFRNLCLTSWVCELGVTPRMLRRRTAHRWHMLRHTHLL
jgi:hypothetical protein